MLIASKLAQMVPQIAVDVYLKKTSGALEDAATYSGIPAMHQQSKAEEDGGRWGEITTQIIDTFIFDRLVATGALPVIVEEHVIVWSGTNYDVISAINHGRDMRLFVDTERIR